jgi:SAM-dependent methyltransferase
LKSNAGSHFGEAHPTISGIARESRRTTTQNRRGQKLPGPSLSAEQQKLVDAHFQASATYWTELYQREDLYATIHRQRRGVVLALLAKLALPPESRILEIGCGSGTTTVALAQRGYHVDAVDTVNAMLDLTRQLAVDTGVGDRVMTGSEDVHDLAFPDNVFELAVAMGVVPYLHSPAKAVQEMARVLRPGGYLIVNADNRWRLNYVLDPRRFPAFAAFRWKLRDAMEGFGLLKPLPRPRARMHSIKEFDALLSVVGLEKLEAMTLGFGSFSFFNRRLFPDPWEVKAHQRLQSLADRGFPLIRSTGAQYIVLAKKPAAN